MCACKLYFASHSISVSFFLSFFHENTHVREVVTCNNGAVLPLCRCHVTVQVSSLCLYKASMHTQRLKHPGKRAA